MGIGHEAIRHRRHVHEPVLMDADINERAERGDVGDDTFEHHAGREVGDLLHTVGEGRGGEGRTRVTSGFSNSARMSVTVGTPKRSSAKSAGRRDRRVRSLPINSARPMPERSRIRRTTG